MEFRRGLFRSRPTEKGRKIAKKLAVDLAPITNSLSLARYVTKDPRFSAMCVHGNNYTQTRNLNAVSKYNYNFPTQLFAACNSAMIDIGRASCRDRQCQ